MYIRFELIPSTAVTKLQHTAASASSKFCQSFCSGSSDLFVICARFVHPYYENKINTIHVSVLDINFNLISFGFGFNGRECDVVRRP